MGRDGEWHARVHGSGTAPPRRDTGRPRLPIDRAFTMAGFGTVVTGTLVDGSLAAGDEVEIVPGGIRARIRGMQTHRRAIETATPGRRVAVNLSGVYYGLKHGGEAMAARSSGSIINLASVLGLVALPRAGAYTASR